MLRKNKKSFHQQFRFIPFRQRERRRRFLSAPCSCAHILSRRLLCCFYPVEPAFVLKALPARATTQRAAIHTLHSLEHKTSMPKKEVTLLLWFPIGTEANFKNGSAKVTNSRDYEFAMVKTDFNFNVGFFLHNICNYILKSVIFFNVYLTQFIFLFKCKKKYMSA
jgi:hypothetical protein